MQPIFTLFIVGHDRKDRIPSDVRTIRYLKLNQDDGNYYLILQKAEASDDQFNRVCNVLSEYALNVDFIPGIEQLFEEHMTTILKEVRAYCTKELDSLWDSIKRFENPHKYYVDLSETLWEKKSSMIEEIRKI